MISENPPDGGSTPRPGRFNRAGFPKFQLISGQGPIRLPKMGDLKQNGDCPFCTLVYESVLRYSDWSVDDETECFMEWDVDGRQAKSKDLYANVSRRIRISWSRLVQGNGHPEKKQEELYFLYVPPRNPMRPNADTNSVGEKETHFLARDYDSDHGNQAFIRSWIRLCEQNHQGACTQMEDERAFRNLVRETSFGVIDVVDLMLTQLPLTDDRPARYVALSYVWGPKRGKDHRTLRSNVMRRIQPGGLEEVWDDLPRTIQNAIQLVRNLGERYIWIDSLCIVQDSPTSWRNNAMNMDLVYGNAYFTICAADGDDSDVGLIAMDPHRMDVPLKADIEADLQLLVSRPSESIIQASTWNKRAWTFQERILSHRCLIFVGKRIYFQCRSTNMSQDIYPDGTGKGWSSDWRNSPLRTLKELEERPIWFYMACVSLYTGRNLTLPKDILDAFDGVMRLMEVYMRAPFFFGLPSSHFDFALLWQPTSGKKRRQPDATRDGHERCKQDQDGKCICRQDEKWFEDVEFPSWSWSGWMDVQDPRKGAAVNYPHELLAGCLIDLRDWLLNHTWIVWYIRDWNGDLQPLWEGYPARYPVRTRKVDERWKGYKGPREDNRDNEDYYSREVVIYREKGPRGHEMFDHDYHTREVEEDDIDVDNYGRPLRPSVRRRIRTNFRGILPDNPFGVCVPNNRTGTKKRRYQPILQFWTWRCEFYILHNTEAPSPGDGLARCHVADKSGDWCGSVVVNEDWAQKNEERLCQFIAISDAKNFAKDECTNWTHYIPKDQEDVEWDLYYVLLIQPNLDRLVWERVGLGKVFQAAFELSNWDEIKLG